MRSIFQALIVSGSLSLLAACSPSNDDDNSFPQVPSGTSGSPTGSPSASSSGAPTASSSSGSPTTSSGGTPNKTPVAFKTVNPGNCHMAFDGKEHDGNDKGGTPPTGGSDGHTLEVSCIYVEGGVAMSAIIAMDSVNGPGTYDVGVDSFGTAVFSKIDEPGMPADTHTATEFRVTLSKVRDGHVIGGAELDINGKSAVISFDLAHD